MPKAKGKPKKKVSKKDISEKLLEKLENLGVQLERANISEYIHTVRRPWKVIAVNFGMGIARGFGTAIGMTIIFALIIIILTQILSKLISLPLIGQQIAKIVEYVNQYMGEASRFKIK